MKNSVIPDQIPNRILALLGVVALVHSILCFGSGTLPEAILAALLFLKAFSNHRQPWTLLAIGLAAVAISWIINSKILQAGPTKTALSVIGIALFAIVAFSRPILERGVGNAGTGGTFSH